MCGAAAWNALFETGRLHAFLETHRIKPVIDRTFSMDDVQEAFVFMQQEKHVGKIVIGMAPLTASLRGIIHQCRNFYEFENRTHLVMPRDTFQ